VLAATTGEHWSDSVLHRIRGELLLKCDVANTVPADEALSGNWKRPFSGSAGAAKRVDQVRVHAVSGA
jgi:hypothetical protein